MIPSVLIAGFLGAGKTRFLSEIIPLLHRRGVRVRVLLNDFENASIDAARLGALHALVTPLNGECVCCGSLRELMEALRAVPTDPGSVLLIEANGATEADELLGYLTMDRGLSHFTPPLQLTVIDAGRWQKRWWYKTLERSQTSTATHVQLNWTHRLAAERLRRVEQEVRDVAPRASFTTPSAFADALTALVAQVRGVALRKSLLPMAREVEADAPRRSTQHAAHVHPFASAALPLPQIVRRDAFLRFARELPPSVVRAKGLVRFSDLPNEMMVWNRMPNRGRVQLDRSWPHAEAIPTALFIGVMLPLDELQARMDALRIL